MLAESRRMVKAGNMNRAEWTFEGEQKRISGVCKTNRSYVKRISICQYALRWVSSDTKPGGTAGISHPVLALFRTGFFYPERRIHMNRRWRNRYMICHLKH